MAAGKDAAIAAILGDLAAEFTGAAATSSKSSSSQTVPTVKPPLTAVPKLMPTSTQIYSHVRPVAKPPPSLGAVSTRTVNPALLSSTRTTASAKVLSTIH